MIQNPHAESGSSPPSTIPYSFEKIPEYFTQRPQWVCWKWVKRDSKWTKPPYQAKRIGAAAKSTDRTTWATFDEAVAAYKNPASGYAGIGYCLDPETEEIVATDENGNPCDHVTRFRQNRTLIGELHPRPSCRHRW